MWKTVRERIVALRKYLPAFGDTESILISPLEQGTGTKILTLCNIGLENHGYNERPKDIVIIYVTH